jgi:hypothetical protein
MDVTFVGYICQFGTARAVPKRVARKTKSQRMVAGSVVMTGQKYMDNEWR